MAVSATSTALQNAAGYSTKWHQKRIHRKLDDRDDVIDEALEIMEDFDVSVYPHISGIQGFSAGEADATASGDITMSVMCKGAALTGATITAVLGGVSATTVTITSATQLDLTFPGGAAAFDYGTAAAGDMVPLYVRVNNVLLPPVTLTLV